MQLQERKNKTNNYMFFGYFKNPLNLMGFCSSPHPTPLKFLFDMIFAILSIKFYGNLPIHSYTRGVFDEGDNSQRDLM